MLEQLIYQNHRGEKYEFGKDGIFVKNNDLHDYEWAVTQKGGRIAALDYAVSKRKLPITIICETEEEGIRARNRLMEVTEKDVLAMKHGRIIIGDYYFRCFVTKSEKKKGLWSKRHMEVTLTLTSDFPYWVKEEEHFFNRIGEGFDWGKNLDFAHDLPYDFYSGTGSKILNNTGFVPTNFRMVIHGIVTNPIVYISGHAYQVLCDVAKGETLTIDSIKKTITLTAANGTETNVFNLRNRDSYIFEKIPPGDNRVIWTGNFKVDVTLLEERSEPGWT